MQRAEAISKPPDVNRLLFFTRGRGRGHALPDLLIADNLRRLCNTIDLQFVSYGTGAITLREAHAPVIDLGFDDDNDFLETLFRSAQCIRDFSPDLVIAHEEFAAIPAAVLSNTRVVFIVDWFLDPSTLLMQTLRYAERVLFISEAGTYQEPDYLKGRIHYTGDLIRPLSYRLSDRLRARHELGVGSGSVVISVIPGIWANESRSPIFDLIVSAVEKLTFPDKHLFWVAGTDYSHLLSRAAGRPFVNIVEHHEPIEQLMVCSDIVITKANRGTTMEVDELGVRSISLSFGFNPVDDIAVARLRSNVALNARAVTSEFLAEKLSEGVSCSRRGLHADRPVNNRMGNAVLVAQLLHESLAINR
jgi:hypothetical protein